MVLPTFLPQVELDALLERRLPAFTRRTTTDPAGLRAELADIRQSGYAISGEDLAVGAAAVAPPIRDWSGKVVAAVSVAGPVARVRDGLNTVLRVAVVAAAEQIPSQLGYSEPRKGNPHAIASLA